MVSVKSYQVWPVLGAQCHSTIGATPQQQQQKYDGDDGIYGQDNTKSDADDDNYDDDDVYPSIVSMSLINQCIYDALSVSKQ